MASSPSLRGRGEQRVLSWLLQDARRAARCLPDGVSVAFEITGPGGGAWTLARTDRGVEVQEGRALLVDSSLRCPVGRFFDLVDGRMDPRSAFLDRDVELEGDIGLLLRLQGAL